MRDSAQIVRVCCAAAGALLVPLLWSMGLVGGGKYDERVARWTIDITAYDDHLLVRDHITMDFGNEYGSSLDRVIDHGLGAPEEVFGYPQYISPDQPLPGPGSTVSMSLSEQPVERSDRSTLAHLQTEFGRRATGVQSVIAAYGLPDKPELGEHFDYELINAGRSVGANDVYVYLDGMTLESLTCRRGSGTACELQATDGYYVVEIASLPADDSLTIGGTVTGWSEPVDHPYPERVEPRVAPRGMGWLTLVLSIPAAIAGWHIPLVRWRRRNAARWASAATPGLAAITGEPTDERVLVPLPAIAPWEGAALFRQELGLTAPAAWFAQQLAAGVLTVDTVDKTPRFRRGPNFDDVDLGLHEPLHRMLGRKDGVQLDPYDRAVKRVIGRVSRGQASSLSARSWWRRFAPSGHGWFSPEVAVVMVAWAAVLVGLIVTRWSYSWPVAFALVVVVPASINAAVSWFMSPELSVEGEDVVATLAPLQQMLRRADTSHVEAAHRAGLLPEYGVWAVAFGAPNRWRAAVRAAALPDETTAAALAPLEMGRSGGPWSITANFPSNEVQPPLQPKPADE